MLESLKSVEALHPLSFPTAEPLLKVSDLRRSFDGNLAVADASFEVKAGGIMALIGDNGSGKTTIINLITGLLRPDAGSVVNCGERATGRSAHHVSALGVTRTFQIPQLIGELTVRENVEVGLLRATGSGSLAACSLASPPGRTSECDELRLTKSAACLASPSPRSNAHRAASAGPATARGSRPRHCHRLAGHLPRPAGGWPELLRSCTS